MRRCGQRPTPVAPGVVRMASELPPVDARVDAPRIEPADEPTDELAAVFARVSAPLLPSGTVDTSLRLITSSAKETFTGAAGSGITLSGSNGDRVTAAATDVVVERADALQYELGQGPCLTAWEQRTVVRVDDERTAFLILVDMARRRGKPLRQAADDLVRSTIRRPR